MYDPKCHELAIAFLEDEKPYLPEDVSELAQQIQDTIEAYFAAREDVSDVE